MKYASTTPSPSWKISFSHIFSPSRVPPRFLAESFSQSSTPPTAASQNVHSSAIWM